MSVTHGIAAALAAQWENERLSETEREREREGRQLAPLPAPPLLQQPSLPQAAAPGEWFVSGRPGCLVALTNFWLSDQLTVDCDWH